jgi:hypothetical protein
MEIFWDIVIHTVEILTLLFGVLGMAFSLLLLFSPRMTKSLSSYFNRSISLESKINFLDMDIPTEAFIYSHHVVFLPSSFSFLISIYPTLQKCFSVPANIL